ncbi:MAG: hypothetical protein OEY11_13995, partial [Gammaproteobacteria bacterium]|nr:hypothetical protein [Gammaproteobacteria bacterium]
MQNILKSYVLHKFWGHLRSVTVISGLLLLTACGGGGGGTGGGSAPGTGDNGGVITGGDSISTPATLEVTSTYSDTLSPVGTAYYAFTTIDGAFKYTMDLSGLSGTVSWTLYTDAAYSNSIDSCYQSSENYDCDSPTLDANTTYYLSVMDVSGAANSFNINIQAILLSEGSYTTPVALTVGTPHLGTLGPKLYSSSV